MSAVARRLVVFAGRTPNPRLAPQNLLVDGVVAVRIDPVLIAVEAGEVTPNPDFWDVLVNPNFDADAYVRLHDAELQEDGTIIVKRDLFGPGDYPHTWAGWPIPGDPGPATPKDMISPQSREYKALAPVRAKKGKK